MNTLEVNLPNGRTISCSVFGDPALRKSIFYFHGYPGSRLEGGLAADSAASRGISVIGVDRPGFGGSSHYFGRKLLDWPADVAALADHLGVKKFSVLGCSGGAPYTLACAYYMPERINSCGIVSGLGPIESAQDVLEMNLLNRSLLLCARKYPALAYGFVSALAKVVSAYPHLLVGWLRFISPNCDRLILSRQPVQALLTKSFATGLRGKFSDIAADMSIIAQPWGFALEQIQIPVHLWHGTADHYVPLSMGQSMASRLAKCSYRFVPDAGHFMIVELIEEIITSLFAPL
ncbi:MAG: alpha/beta hydrolase [Oligoflexia bacterium]|nr:alpha/beta hydrolase [Oligoflexia bacterium]